MAPSGKVECWAATAPGLERLTRDELVALGIERTRVERGGVGFRATPRQLYAANMWLRTGSRVLVRAGGFKADTFHRLQARATNLDWGRYIAVGRPVRFRVTSHQSKLYHTDAIAERLAAVIGSPLAPAEDDDAQLVLARLVDDEISVSIDSSGEHLHRRGWRLDTAKAPLRETLAAALIQAAGWEPTMGLLDPLCGSGTIAIEAAHRASGRAPGANRSFAFEHWPSFEPGTWASVTGAARAAVSEPDELGLIRASDRDDGAIAAAEANAERAGVSHLIELTAGSLSAVGHPAPEGWLVTNPPWGKRVGARTDLRNLFSRLGQVTGSLGPDWRLALWHPDAVMAGHTGRELSPALTTSSGGVTIEAHVEQPT